MLAAVASVPVTVVVAGNAEGAAAAELVAATGSTVDVAAELARPIARLWLAYLPGFAPAAGLLLAWTAADELHVIDLVTRAELRRRGVARALLTAALNEAAARGLRLALLEVRASNVPAIRLYSAAGFETYHVRRGYYADGEDALEMSLDGFTTTSPTRSAP